MSSNYQQTTFIINFSNNKRKYIENQKANTNIHFRKQSILELIAFQYIPCIGASTLLAPFNRLKVIMQVQNVIPIPREAAEAGSAVKSKLSISNLVKSKIIL
jgi:hypothetical protein